MSLPIYRIVRARLFFIPVQTRVPLKFGPETLTSVTCARVEITIEDHAGRRARGWGETPLSVQWVWPAVPKAGEEATALSYAVRHEALRSFCSRLAQSWTGLSWEGHPLELGWRFQEEMLPGVLRDFHGPTPCAQTRVATALPWLAALVCASPYDLALHDAFANLLNRPMYETYRREFFTNDLSAFLAPAPGADCAFGGRYPSDFLDAQPPTELPAWHLVGGLDLIDADELTGTEPRDGHPVLLPEWIQRDGLKCLKVKLRGTDAAWDYERLRRVGRIAREHGVEALSADFNCTVQDPAYVMDTLDRLGRDEPWAFEHLLYVEQPFPYELEEFQIDVRDLGRRKPLFLDESAHDWRMVRLGRELGWTGVALKTCKTQTGAILSACWARAHGMQLMVQDLTNPMLAQVPHVLLAANVRTIMGVETNAMQFYPAASEPEARIHPGLYRRRQGCVSWASVRGPGFGYRVEEIRRELPEPDTVVEAS